MTPRPSIAREGARFGRGTPTTIAAQVQPYDVVVDGTSLYGTLNFAIPSHGTIVKITPK
jgi:hypothetical protein